MENLKFDELWEKIRLIAHEIKNTCQDGTDVREDSKKDLLQAYNELRTREGKGHIRESVSSNSVIHLDATATLMDRHKVAACMAGAILKVGILSEPKGKPPTKRKMISYFANETLAAFAGLAIVKAFIRSDTDNKIGFPDKILMKKDKFLKDGYIFPTPIQDEYLPWLIYALSDSKKENIGFNVMAFSNIFYLLEAYTFSQLGADS